MNKEMLIIATAAMSERVLVEELRDTCSKYLLDPKDKEELMNEIVQLSHMIAIKPVVGNEFQKAMDFINKMKKSEEREKLFQVDEN